MLYISPPFGNYFSYKEATRIRGTFTANPRKGLIYHTLRSLRPVKGGWRNQIGFRNKGIKNISLKMNSICSVCGLNESEWETLVKYLPSLGSRIELNLSCPNVNEISIPDDILKEFIYKFPNLIVKVRYDISETLAAKIRLLGVNHLHCSNTIPTDKGGISGKPLRNLNVYAIQRLSQLHFPSLIAGGGIYSRENISEYRAAGATAFSISTAYITCPWNIPSIYREANSLWST